MRKVAVIAMGPSEAYAPWRDPDWEVWCMAWHPFVWHAQRAFEIHPIDLVMQCRKPDYPEVLQEIWDQGIPLYFQSNYPLKEISSLVGDYFGSSPAYLIAMAIYEGVDHIGIWGLDLSEDIYDHQRPNIEYLIGFARGKGITVEVHEMSKLLTLRKHDKIGDLDVIYPQRYGWVA